ncbi:MAG: hypothetical protein M1837_003992 [Sclerophora amabilis]|nr:MAG: hypothetical protein M1837_003992 [Sclerophora amabilis]
MPLTRVYFIPESSTSASSTTLQTVIDRVTKQFVAEPMGRWSLEHRLMRETAPPTQVPQNDKLPSPKYLQILSLSHHPGRTWVGISKPSQPQELKRSSGTTEQALADANGSKERQAERPLSTSPSFSSPTVIAVPSPSHSEEFVHLLLTKMGPLWTPRQTLVSRGLGFEAGDFRVRVGEVKQGQGTTQSTKGVIVEVEWVAGIDEAVVDRVGEGQETEQPQMTDWEDAYEVTNAFWDELGIQGAKAAARVAGMGDGERISTSGVATQYFDLLRLR